MNTAGMSPKGEIGGVFGPEAWEIAVAEKPDIEIMMPIVLSAILLTLAMMLSIVRRT